MSDVVSIFSGQAPCYNLEMNNDDFYKSFKFNPAEFTNHMDDCRECSVRFNIVAKYKLTKVLIEEYMLNGE